MYKIQEDRLQRHLQYKTQLEYTPVVQTNLFVDVSPTSSKEPTLNLKLASNYDGTTIEVSSEDNTVTRCQKIKQKLLNAFALKTHLKS